MPPIVIDPMVNAWLLVIDRSPRVLLVPEDEAIVDNVLVALLRVIALLPTSAKL